MSTLPPESNGEQSQAQPAPAQPAYEPPPAGAPQAHVADPVSTITLNYWLSVFFTWVPALIFWIIEKDKGNARATAFHVANLNFSLLRTAVGVVIWIFSFIPYIGWIFGLLLGLGSIVLFVFHIVAAAKAPEDYRGSGKADPFIFNIQRVQ